MVWNVSDCHLSWFLQNIRFGRLYSYEKYERDPETGKQMYAGAGILTAEELKTEFGGKPIQTTQAAGGILTENSLNDL